jgi:hypothetical protein
MRLPGTRYQEHGWEHVRKLLGQCSLQACAHQGFALCGQLVGGETAAALQDYLEHMAVLLRAGARSGRANGDGNSYGDSVLELALDLLFELQARPGDWQALAAAVTAEAEKLGPFWQRPGGDAILRKKVNDMYAVLRDKVDADNYMAACGRPCSANRIYAYRMLDTAYADIARLFALWAAPDSLAHEQVGAILGRAVSAAAAPIEVRQLKSIGDCRSEWILAWSASRERFTGAPGPLHTRSKRFASLKGQPDKIAAMLREIGEYEELSANRDNPWQQDAVDAAGWLDDLARVMEQASGEGGELLPAPEEDIEAAPDDAAVGGSDEAVPDAAEALAAARVSLPPSYLAMARRAQDGASWAAKSMAPWSMPVRLAVYASLMGGRDDSYPSEWLDPATGELPTMQQLAVLDGISLPTLRKRRDAAIAALQAAPAAPYPDQTRDIARRTAQ